MVSFKQRRILEHCYLQSAFAFKMGSDFSTGNSYLRVTSLLFGSSSWACLKSQTWHVYLIVGQSQGIRQLHTIALNVPARSVDVKYSVLLNSN
jgi:hypothetical protein